MQFTEHALLIPCQGDAMVGVLSRPGTPSTLGLVVVVGGPQYRVGSHRQFVLLARRLASAGYPVLRFDYRGMGDSEGEARGFESIDQDIAAAIDALKQACPSVGGVVLWGLCDGAAAALLYCGATRDARVAGLCLLNPWVRSEATLARTHLKHHYSARLLQVDFWKKVFSGKFRVLQSLRELWGNFQVSRSGALHQGAESPFQVRMAQALRQYSGRVLLLLSANDYTAKEFLETASTDPLWSGLLHRPGLERVDVDGADHTFSRQQWRASAEQAVLQWMGTFKP
ncbi:hydrolase 1, exosortase A system-associated [Rhodoferax sp. GW822-FHT02A01]|uniref:hydrolase 1, exosortase A system-associated n=1 Tax=Rhodoferax sp. GW822-FHT02A01 TaxID=3141537 RepID=UPI00315CDFD8